MSKAKDRPDGARADSDALTPFRASIPADELDAATRAGTEAGRRLLHAQLDAMGRRRARASGTP